MLIRVLLIGSGLRARIYRRGEVISTRCRSVLMLIAIIALRWRLRRERRPSVNLLDSTACPEHRFRVTRSGFALAFAIKVRCSRSNWLPTRTRGATAGSIIWRRLSGDGHLRAVRSPPLFQNSAVLRRFIATRAIGSSTSRCAMVAADMRRLWPSPASSISAWASFGLCAFTCRVFRAVLQMLTRLQHRRLFMIVRHARLPPHPLFRFSASLRSPQAVRRPVITCLGSRAVPNASSANSYLIGCVPLESEARGFAAPAYPAAV